MKRQLISSISSTKVSIRKLLLGSSVFLLLVASCKNDTSINAKCECPKDESRYCTFQYVTITVYIKDQTDAPVVLDEYTVKKISNKQTVSKHYDLSPGYYAILSDSQLALTNTCGEEFEFIGKKNGKQIVETRFTIAHNCCHVVLLKGEREIKVKL